MQSITPARSAVDQRLAVGSVRSGGFIFMRVSSAADVLVGQAEVVRRGLAASTCTPRSFAAATASTDCDAAEVLHVDAAALVAGDRRVARDHRRLGDARDAGDAEQRADLALVHRAVARERRVLLVQREHAAAQALVLQRLAQHPGARRPAGRRR